MASLNPFLKVVMTLMVHSMVRTTQLGATKEERMGTLHNQLAQHIVHAVGR